MRNVWLVWRRSKSDGPEHNRTNVIERSKVGWQGGRSRNMRQVEKRGSGYCVDNNPAPSPHPDGHLKRSQQKRVVDLCRVQTPCGRGFIHLGCGNRGGGGTTHPSAKRNSGRRFAWTAVAKRGLLFLLLNCTGQLLYVRYKQRRSANLHSCSCCGLLGCLFACTDAMA